MPTVRVAMPVPCFTAAANGTFMGSMAHGHANRAAVKNAIYDVVTAHFNGEYDAATGAKIFWLR